MSHEGIETDLRDGEKVGVNKGRWSSLEHFKFLEGIKMFGKDWKKLNLHIKTRTSVQIRSHAQKFFSKLSKEIKTLEQFQEDTDLEELKKNLLQSEIPQPKSITAESTNHTSNKVPVHQPIPKDSPQTEVPIKIPVQIDPEVNKVASIPNPPLPRRTREKEERKETDDGEKSSKVSKSSSKGIISNQRFRARYCHLGSIRYRNCINRSSVV
ncbi:unnamed protein product [Moneuplotes crassus]|uniref:Uncharacterized protein n=1 Tax=Euplotes crassus TaxID=5936 RepID=A0AAD1XRU1_EUPCR|nr:unnamed protein product [Moneuplotes crassus]